MAGRYQDSVTAFEKSISMDSDFYLGYYSLACVYALLNRDEDARKAAENVLRLNPEFSLKNVVFLLLVRIITGKHCLPFSPGLLLLSRYS